MNFTGRNLDLVERAIEMALVELHNQIGTVPNVIQHEDMVIELENEVHIYQRLLARVRRTTARQAGDRT